MVAAWTGRPWVQSNANSTSSVPSNGSSFRIKAVFSATWRRARITSLSGRDDTGSALSAQRDDLAKLLEPVPGQGSELRRFKVEVHCFQLFDLETSFLEPSLPAGVAHRFQWIGIFGQNFDLR